MAPTDPCCGWHGTVAEFLALDQATLLTSLEARHLRVMGAPPSGEQIAARRGEYEILGVALREIVASVPRARDAQRVLEKRGHDRSEPEDFLSIGSRKDSWALMVGLIGEGQEIYLGEEAGLTQWNDAIAKTSDSWTVHCPRKIADIFDSAERLDINESLDLDMSLRTHLAEDVQGWVEDLLDGRLDAAAAHAEAMEKQGFRLYLTRELERATGYVRERVAA